MPSERRCLNSARPMASSEAARRRMQSTPQRDTPAELRIRKLLHAMGLRYLVDAKPLEGSPRRADVVFRRARVAVFVDGCFWHGCPEHGTWPKANEQFWRAKILANIERDAETNDRLRDRGWLVIRVWEHEDPSLAATRIARQVRSKVSMTTKRRSSTR
jgi:DNA mismatch endonuclease (patch repair protein)